MQQLQAQSDPMQKALMASQRISSVVQQSRLSHSQGMQQASVPVPRASSGLLQGPVGSVRASPATQYGAVESPRAALAPQQGLIASPRASPALQRAVSGPQLGSTGSLTLQQDPQQAKAMQQGLAGLQAFQHKAAGPQTQTLAESRAVTESIRSNLKQMKPNLRTVDEDMLPKLPVHADVPAEVRSDNRPTVKLALLSLLDTFPPCGPEVYCPVSILRGTENACK